MENTQYSKSKLATLEAMAQPIDFEAPYVCFAHPAEGCTLLIQAAKEGGKVLVIAGPDVMPEQYRDIVSTQATFVEADIYTNDGFDKAAEIAQEKFDAFFFLGSYAGDDPETGAESELVTIHLHQRLVDSGRLVWLCGSGMPVEEFPSEPLNVVLR